MFTIMHELPDGTQEVFSAVQLQYRPFTEENGDTAGVQLLCGPDEGGPGVSCGHLKTGTVYVMNEKGATVSRFFLNRPPAQPRVD